MIRNLVNLALFSRYSVAFSKVSPIMAISMLKIMIWIMNVETRKRT